MSSMSSVPRHCNIPPTPEAPVADKPGFARRMLSRVISNSGSRASGVLVEDGESQIGWCEKRINQRMEMDGISSTQHGKNTIKNTYTKNISKYRDCMN